MQILEENLINSNQTLDDILVYGSNFLEAI